MSKLAGKVSVITGAAAGIGIAIAGLFAREGAFVVIADKDEIGAEAAAKAIREAGGQAEAIAADVGREDDVRRLLEAVQDRFDAVDVLVNNAGNFIRKDFRQRSSERFRCAGSASRPRSPGRRCFSPATTPPTSPGTRSPPTAA
jgi:NAD(P)-dependent dehydrogenase (short-subunit alcohol dehydrogenase family)